MKSFWRRLLVDCLASDKVADSEDMAYYWTYNILFVFFRTHEMWKQVDPQFDSFV